MIMGKVEKMQAMCDHCGWRRVADASSWSDLVEVPGCSACHGKKYKCPNCGFTIKARKFTVPITNEEPKKEEQQTKQHTAGQ